MIINKQSTLHSIKSEFHHLFPYLKLEFYRHNHEVQEASPKSDQILHDDKISDLTGHDVKVDIKISPEMSVAEFENIFFKTTGLGVQVFRSSHGVWLQTSATDSWSLEKQNGKGERSESHLDVEPLDITDFDVD